MVRTLRHLVLGLSLLAAGASSAEEIMGPEVVASESAIAKPAPVPQCETKALGVPDRANVKSPTKVAPAGAPKPVVPNALQGVVGPLAVVLVLIAMLAGLVVLIARIRSKMGGGASLGASFGAGGRSPAGILEVLGRYPLARGLTLVLLKVDRRVLLLSQTRSGRFGGLSLSPICELDSPEDVASILLKVRDADSSSLTNRFASVFRSLDREAVDKVDGAEGKVMTTIAPPETLPRRAKTVTHKAAAMTEQTGAESAASIRRRLDDLRVPGMRDARGAKP
ncbi:MAG: hypothetical protein ACREJD_09815 [Phycisphaerales bacterium]